MKFIEYPDSEMMMLDLANTLAGDIENALLTKDTASFSVPGGTTPGPIFDSLSAADLEWDRVRIFLNDERWVPEDSDRSNTRLLKQRLFVNKAAAATHVPLYAPADAPEDKLDELSGAIEANLPLDVLLLGMGADMHTASLFPGADQLDLALSDAAPTLLAMRAPGAPEPRITLSAPALAGALKIHVVIKGAEKRAAIEAAQHLSPTEAPIASVLSHATVHWAES